MTGPQGAHVFEPTSFPDCSGTCREYTVQLSVWDGTPTERDSIFSITEGVPADGKVLVGGYGVLNLVNGDVVTITGTTNYNGTFAIDDKQGGGSSVQWYGFTITDTWVGAESGGRWHSSPNTDIDTETITVYDPDDGTNGWGDPGTGTLSVCVYENGGAVGGGCPAVADTYESPANDLDADLTTLIGAPNNYRRILLKGGETWVADTWPSYEFNAAGPGLLGSYGGTEAIIDNKITYGEYRGVFRMNTSDWRFQDLSLTSSLALETTVAKWFISSYQTTTAENWLIQRTEFSDNDFTAKRIFELSHGFLATHSLPQNDANIHRRVFLVDNTWGELTYPDSDQDDYFVYAAVWGLNILGNNFGGTSGSSEKGHIIRIATGEDVLISNNIIGPPPNVGNSGLTIRDLPSHCSTCPEDSTTRAFCLRPTKHFVIQDNEFILGPDTAAIDTTKACTTPPHGLGEEDYIIERNYIYNSPTGSAIIGIDASPSDNETLVIRNNIIDLTGFVSNRTGIKATSDPAYGHPEDIMIYNNTCYSSSSVNSVYCIQPWSTAPADMRNNVLYAPNVTTLDNVRVIGTNTNPYPNPYLTNNYDNSDDGSPDGGIGNPFISAAPSAAEDFKISLDSELAKNGAKLDEVFLDYGMDLRYRVFEDVGAWRRTRAQGVSGGEGAEGEWR
jgi:hypothetical protein